MAIFRRTQGRFRRGLLERRHGCDLCGMTVEPLLVASHILPWSIADEHQRQDPDNGLLLCVTHSRCSPIDVAGVSGVRRRADVRNVTKDHD
ncbi:HNH endonuclease [Bacillus subtilis]